MAMRKENGILQLPMWIFALAMTAGGIGLSSPVNAEVHKSATVSLVGEITAVDQSARTVTVSSSDGDTQTIEAGPEVRNFSQLKAGDKVTVRYKESLLLDLQTEGTPGDYTSEMGSQAAKGAKPAAGVSRREVITAKIVSVDTTANTITLQGPKGNTMTFDVKTPERQARLKKLQPGQLIRATYDEALAVSVTPGG